VAGSRAVEPHPAGICAAPVPDTRTQDVALDKGVAAGFAPNHHRRAPIAGTCPSNEKNFMCPKSLASELRTNARIHARQRGERAA
jgi:hypothetical protein